MFTFDIVSLDRDSYEYIGYKMSYINNNYSDILNLSIHQYIDIFEHLKTKYDIHIYLFVNSNDTITVCPSYIHIVNLLSIDLNAFNVFLKNIKQTEFGLVLYNAYDIYLQSNNNSIVTNISSIYTILNNIAAHIKYPKLYWASVNYMKPIISMINKNKFMYLRIGNIELNVINCYKNDKSNLNDVFSKYSNIMTNHNNDDIYDIIKNNHSNLIVSKLLKTTTNAGFYITDKANSFYELEYCINKYLEGYNNCDGFLRCDGCLIQMAELNEPIKPNFTIYLEKDIYTMMKNKNVLIISPFSEQINEQVKSNNYKNLFLDKDKNDILIETYENCNLFSLNIPITIYGNPAHTCWRETYEITCQNIKDFVKGQHIDLVIPSCGFYGIPICNYVYNELNISSVYYGNAIHSLFGILQNSSFETSDIDVNKWVTIDENVINKISNNNGRLFENLKKIDVTNGKCRYLRTN